MDWRAEKERCWSKKSTIYNRSVEWWHNAFAKRVSIAHPTITKLTDKIRREQSKFEVDIAQIRQGQEPKPKKATY
ncbi:unnamed protein product [Rotaria magnacalcarata]